MTQVRLRVNGKTVTDDVHAPASYRQHLAAVMSRRALVAAHGRVGRA